MRTASRVFYIISVVCSLICVAVYGLCSWVMFRGMANSQWDFFKTFMEEIQKTLTQYNITVPAGLDLPFICGIAFGAIAAVYFVVFIFALWGSRAAKYSTHKAAHIWSLILGILSLDVILIVAAALGLGASNKEVELG
ncbi:MAG: hypothetical protein IJU60_05735 [Acholeplasmatales bacterium]|nr:hypothetical protein [Acholeplasmatales bacterium]